MAKCFIKHADGFIEIAGYTKASERHIDIAGVRQVGRVPILYDELVAIDASYRLDKANEFCKNSRRKKVFRVATLPAWQVDYIEEFIRYAAQAGRKATMADLLQEAVNLFYAHHPLPPTNGEK